MVSEVGSASGKAWRGLLSKEWGGWRAVSPSESYWKRGPREAGLWGTCGHVNTARSLALYICLLVCVFLCGLESHRKILGRGKPRSDFCFLKEKYRSLALMSRPGDRGREEGRPVLVYMVKHGGHLGWGVCGGGCKKHKGASGCVLNVHPMGPAAELDARGQRMNGGKDSA